MVNIIPLIRIFAKGLISQINKEVHEYVKQTIFSNGHEIWVSRPDLPSHESSHALEYLNPCLR